MACGGASLAVVLFMLVTHRGTGVTHLRTDRADFRRESTLSRHRIGCKRTYVGAFDAQAYALRHHFGMTFREACRNAVVTRGSARITLVETLLIGIWRHRSPSLCLEVQLPDQWRPALELCVHVTAKLGRRAADRIHEIGAQPGLHPRIAHGLDQRTG